MKSTPIPILLCTLLLVALSSQGDALAINLTFDPPVVYADSAEVFTVSLMAADFDSTSGFICDLTYDGSLIEFISAEQGNLFSDYTPPSGFFWSVVYNATSISIESLILTGGCEAGPGELLKLNFRCLDQHEVTELSLDTVTVRDCIGAPILPVFHENATLVLGPMADFFFNPDPKVVLGAGHPCRIGMEVSAVDSLRGFQVYLSYDNTKIDFDSARVGGLLTGPTAPPLWWYVTEESSSQIRIEGAVLGPGTFVNGPGQLIDLYFHGLVDFDSTEVVFDQWHLWDVNTAEFFPVAVDNGLIIIDAALQDVTEPDPPVASTPDRLTILAPIGNPGPNPGFYYRSPDTSPLTARFYDLAGRLIRQLSVSGSGGADDRLIWDGNNQTGDPVSPGLYFVHLSDHQSRVSGKLMILR